MDHHAPPGRAAAVAPREARAVAGRFELLRRAVRVLLAGALLWVALLAVQHMEQLRHAEAWAGAQVVEVVMGESYHPPGSALVYFPDQPGTTRALEITWQCSVVWAAVPVLALTAGMVLVPRTSVRRLLGASAAAIVVVAVVNQLRLLVIALATARWGRDGFEVSHRLVGSGLVLLSVAAALSLVWRSGPPSPEMRTSGDGRGTRGVKEG